MIMDWRRTKLQVSKVVGVCKCVGPWVLYNQHKPNPNWVYEPGPVSGTEVHGRPSQGPINRGLLASESKHCPDNAGSVRKAL